MSALAAAAALVAAAAIAFAGRVAFARLRAPRLPASLADPPAVAVLLPVRDEEDNVEACLAALLAQTTPVRVLVLDDGSTDRTRERAARIAGADRRVELLAVPPPASGRSGKVNALGCGLDRLERGAEPGEDWILSIDADARPRPEALARALAAARQHGLAALSLAARQRTAAAGEALLTPTVFALLDALLGDWDAAARGEQLEVANGQFFLLDRRALRLAGGFDAIREEPLDDVALARRLTATGHRVGFWRARGQLEVRMYRGFAATFRGWRRNLALIFGARPAPAIAFAAVSLVPSLMALLALLGGAPAAALVAWAGGALASGLLRAGTGSPVGFALLYPLDGVAFAGCLAAALADRRRGRLSAWRGRRLDP